MNTLGMHGVPEDLIGVIESRLPELAAKHIKTQLKRLEELEASIAELEKHLKAANNRRGELELELNTYRSKDETYRDLQQRGDVVAAKEREFDYTNKLHEMECDFWKERVKDHKEMFNVVFRNTVIRRNALTPVNVAGETYWTTDSMGNQVQAYGPGTVQDHISQVAEEAE